MTPLNMDIKNGRLLGVDFKPSPHHDERPVGVSIDLIVIHGISLPPGKFGGDMIEHLFCGRGNALCHPACEEIKHLKVSAHLLIKRTGAMIQFVPFHQRAWHAGESQFGGRVSCNDFSIGIELEGTETMPYAMEQYAVLVPLIQTLRNTYPAITPDRIVGHQDIAPGRKNDPGPHFDWLYLKGMLA